jgi:carbon-monoxide dehydrogenase medium subunit
MARAAEAAAEGVEANHDIHASAEYRLHLAGVLTRRALTLARDRVHAPRRRRSNW